MVRDKTEFYQTLMLRTRQMSVPTRPRAFHPEPLEARLLLATYTVTNTSNDGAGSLRQAIVSANNSAGADTVRFNIPSQPGGNYTIPLTTGLPSITEQVDIDGTTQPGYAAGRPVVQVLGPAAANTQTGFSFNGAPNSRTRGLTVSRWGGNGILISNSPGTVIESNWIGLSADGTAALGNKTGVNVSPGAGGVRIGGNTAAQRNVISGNNDGGLSSGGILLAGDDNVVVGNYVGTNPAGAVALPNGFGVSVSGSRNRIGGTAAGAGNLLSGNTVAGVRITGSSATDNFVQGNLIGTNAAGTAPLRNVKGVEVTAVRANTVGGDTAAARNVISGNNYGVFIAGGMNTLVRNNYVGLAPDGRTPVANDFGVYLNEWRPIQSNPVGNNRIVDNVVSGNVYGVQLLDAHGNFVQRNTIGLNSSRTVAVPNTALNGAGSSGVGVIISLTSSRNLIGGPSRADGNVIAGNEGNGVMAGTASADNTVQNNHIGYAPGGFGPPVVFGNGFNGVMVAGTNNRILDNEIILSGRAGVLVASTNVAVLRNSMQNGGLGIDFRGDGVTPNDSDDAGTTFQNFPVLAGAASDGTQTTVVGTLDSRPNTWFHIELFGTSTPDPSGHGEGQVYLGSVTVTTDAAGDATFTAPLPPVTPGHWITATASRIAGGVPVETSEFSANLLAPPVIDPGPRVTAVFVGASAWGPAFTRHLQDTGTGEPSLGYLVPAGPAQLSPLPWANLNQVSLRFNEPVTVQQDDLIVHATTGDGLPGLPRYNVMSFTYDALTRTATWRLRGAITRPDRLLLDLDAGGASGVKDAAGNALDGEWDDAADAFPSGNGAAGGDFQFRVNVLPGDADRNGRVNVLDRAIVQRAAGSAVPGPGMHPGAYSVFKDLDGSGRVNAIDVVFARKYQRRRLPEPSPLA
jgi:parallel beta-helix repeat protein